MKGIARSFFPDNIRNMVEVRACVYFSVLFLCFHLAAGKPFFTFLFCDLLCDDDDDTTASTASDEDVWDVLLCGGCGTRRPTTPRPTPGPIMEPINFVIPASSNPVNLTFTPGNGFMMNMLPWGVGAPPPAPNAAAPTGPPPAATTPAAAGATTAAAAATTAAPAAPAA